MGAVPQQAPQTTMLARLSAGSSRWAFRGFSAAVIALLSWAWMVRDYRYVQAESGVGYWLGVAGGSLMLVLLLYPLGKRWTRIQAGMTLQNLFRFHMILGVLGPVCILLHSNFNLGSTNSSVALIAMLLVAGSGLVGRYLYGKFHRGLYGRQVQLVEVQSELETVFAQLVSSGGGSPEIEELQRASQQIIDSQQAGVSFRRLLGQRHRLRRMKRQALRAAAQPEVRERMRHQYRSLAGLLNMLAGLRLFERLFALWHVAHIPVFFLMVVTAIVHVFVVHWY